MQYSISSLAKINKIYLYKIILIELLFQDISNGYFTYRGYRDEIDEK